MTETPEPSTQPTSVTAAPPPPPPPPRAKPPRLYAAAAWVVIVAGIIFILSVVFFSGAVIFGHNHYHHFHHGMFRPDGPPPPWGPPGYGPWQPSFPGGAGMPPPPSVDRWTWWSGWPVRWSGRSGWPRPVADDRLSGSQPVATPLAARNCAPHLFLDCFQKRGMLNCVPLGWCDVKLKASEADSHSRVGVHIRTFSDLKLDQPK